MAAKVVEKCSASFWRIGRTPGGRRWASSGTQAALPDKIRDVRGLGLMIGVELTAPAQGLWEELLRRGIICNLSHGVTLRLLPPLNIAEADLDIFAAALEDILRG